MNTTPTSNITVRYGEADPDCEASPPTSDYGRHHRPRQRSASDLIAPGDRTDAAPHGVPFARKGRPQRRLVQGQPRRGRRIRTIAAGGAVGSSGVRLYGANVPQTGAQRQALAAPPDAALHGGDLTYQRAIRLPSPQRILQSWLRPRSYLGGKPSTGGWWTCMRCLAGLTQ